MFCQDFASLERTVVGRIREVWLVPSPLAMRRWTHQRRYVAARGAEDGDT